MLPLLLSFFVVVGGDLENNDVQNLYLKFIPHMKIVNKIDTIGVVVVIASLLNPVNVLSLLVKLPLLIWYNWIHSG